jgi:hypothetical protein
MFQKAIASQNPRMSREQRVELRNNKSHEMTFKRYHRFLGTYSSMLFLEALLPDTLPDLITLTVERYKYYTRKLSLQLPS